MTEQKPSIGRAVHYVGKGGACTAATVTEVDHEQAFLVGLFVTAPGAAHFLPLDEGGALADLTEHQGGTWHWPERV